MPTGDKALFSNFRELLCFYTVTETCDNLGIKRQTRTVRFDVRGEVKVRVQAVTLQVQQSAATTQSYYARFRLPQGQTVESNDLLGWRGRLYKIGGLVFEPGGEFVQVSIEQEARNVS